MKDSVGIFCQSPVHGERRILEVLWEQDSRAGKKPSTLPAIPANSQHALGFRSAKILAHLWVCCCHSCASPATTQPRPSSTELAWILSFSVCFLTALILPVCPENKQHLMINLGSTWQGGTTAASKHNSSIWDNFAFSRARRATFLLCQGPVCVCLPGPGRSQSSIPLPHSHVFWVQAVSSFLCCAGHIWPKHRFEGECCSRPTLWTIPQGSKICVHVYIEQHHQIKCTAFPLSCVLSLTRRSAIFVPFCSVSVWTATGGTKNSPLISTHFLSLWYLQREWRMPLHSFHPLPRHAHLRLRLCSAAERVNSLFLFCFPIVTEFCHMMVYVIVFFFGTIFYSGPQGHSLCWLFQIFKVFLLQLLEFSF